MSPSAEELARLGMIRYIDAFNTADMEQLRQTMHFPLLTLRPSGESMFYPTPEDWRVDFAALREREGWHHSAVAGVRVVNAAPGKIDVLLRAERYRADGTCYLTLGGLYILTRRGDRWGIQVNSAFASPPEITGGGERGAGTN